MSSVINMSGTGNASATINANSAINLSPLSTGQRQTSSYVVPDGRYASAIVSFFVTRGASSGTLTRGTITVNGVEILKERAFLFSGNVTFTSFVGEFTGGGSPINGAWISTGGSSITLTQTPYIAQTFYGGVNGSIASSFGMSGGVVDHATPESVEIWLKAGDVLDGSQNWQAIVTEFGV